MQTYLRPHSPQVRTFLLSCFNSGLDGIAPSFTASARMGALCHNVGGEHPAFWVTKAYEGRERYITLCASA